MTERIVEDWLTKANERLFQYSFCQILSFKGHTVLHLTRHCAMEQGKDIISIDGDGNVCAFQLKGVDAERLSMSKWEEMLSQISKLVYQSPIHPSIKTKAPHKSYLVINANLDEEVQSSVNTFNQNLQNNGLKGKLEIIVKGEFLNDLKEIGNNFWPFKPKNMNLFLQLYLQNGKGFPNKAEISDFLLECLDLDQDPNDKLSANQAYRLLLSTAILNSISLSGFSKQNNYASEFEGTVLYMAHLLGFVEKNGSKNNLWRRLFDISNRHLYNLLNDLCEELSKVEYYHTGESTEGECLTYRPRITYLIALMSLLFLWNNLLQEEAYITHEFDDFIKTFIINNKKHLLFWGEYASPQFLLYYLFERFTNGGANIDFILQGVISIITNYGKTEDSIFTDPYVNFDEYVKLLYGPGKDSNEIKYNKESYSIEAFVHLFARKNYKSAMRLLWPDISKTEQHKFTFTDKLEFYKWRARSGTTEYKIPPLKQSWQELYQLSKEDSGSELPELIKEFPIFYLCFLIVLPHRMNANGSRWITSQLYKRRWEK